MKQTENNRRLKSVLSVCMAFVMFMLSVPVGFAEAQSYAFQNGDIVKYGSYPQTKVSDEGILTQLNADEGEWISYGYYCGNGNTGSMAPSDFMKYKDVELNGVRYRGVVFTAYRPDCSWDEPTFSYPNNKVDYGGRPLPAPYQYQNGYYMNTVYWFSYEPLYWQIFDPGSGSAICLNVIDGQYFQQNYYRTGSEISGEFYADAEHTIYVNDYSKSSIHEWLNTTFSQTAFEGVDLQKLSERSFAYDLPREKAQSTMSAKVYLPSKEEVLNPDYGFGDEAGKIPVNSEISDYAFAQGIYRAWHSRTVYSEVKVVNVCFSCYTRDYYNTVTMLCGIRPAIFFDVSSDNVKELLTSTVRVHYQVADGLAAAPEAVTVSGLQKTPYEVPVPVIEPYNADYSVVSGSFNHRDEDITVTYTRKTAAVEFLDYENRVIADGETVYSYPSAPYGFGVTAPAVEAVPHEKGMHFTGWDTDAYQNVDGQGLENGKITVKALYAPCQYEPSVETEPGCITEGSLLYTCKVCADTYREPIQAVGHSMRYTDSPAAACLTPGHRYYTCINCTYAYDEETKPIGHTYVQHEGKQANCYEEGYKPYRTCENCDYSDFEVIEKTQHHFYSWEYEAPKCMTEGHIAYDYCYNCGYKFIDGERVNDEDVMIPPIGEHSFGEWENDGYCNKRLCTVCFCGELCGHSYEKWIDGVLDCSYCGAHIVCEHPYGMWEGVCPICGQAEEQKPTTVMEKITYFFRVTLVTFFQSLFSFLK